MLSSLWLYLLFWHIFPHVVSMNLGTGTDFQTYLEFCLAQFGQSTYLVACSVSWHEFCTPGCLLWLISLWSSNVCCLAIKSQLGFPTKSNLHLMLEFVFCNLSTFSSAYMKVFAPRHTWTWNELKTVYNFSTCQAVEEKKYNLSALNSCCYKVIFLRSSKIEPSKCHRYKHSTIFWRAPAGNLIVI